MDVRHHMSRHPVTVEPGDSLHKVQLLMRQGHVRRLPVLDNNRVVGIVTDRDIWERSPSRVADSEHPSDQGLMDHLRVMGVMTLQPVTVAPGTSIVDAARLLRVARVGALLVVEAGELLGIITKADLIDALIGAVTAAADASASSVSEKGPLAVRRGSSQRTRRAQHEGPN
ncbi:MAG: CBS domain-containing protein [Candidatus Binatia bacterium]